MDNTIISKLEKELNRWSVSTEVIDLNDEKIDNDTFEPNCVEVVLSLKKDKEIFSIPFQVSNTLDIGEFSPSLSIDSESGATEELRRFLQTIGINEDEVPDCELEELGDWLKEKFGIQKEYDEYISQFGEFVPATRGIDARSKRFIPYKL